MDIKAEKLGLIEWITQLSDVEIIKKLKEIYKEDQSTSDWWNELSDGEKASIEKGIEDHKSGKVYSHEEARKIYEKYL